MDGSRQDDDFDPRQAQMLKILARGVSVVSRDDEDTVVAQATLDSSDPEARSVEEAHGLERAGDADLGSSCSRIWRTQSGSSAWIGGTASKRPWRYALSIFKSVRTL